MHRKLPSLFSCLIGLAGGLAGAQTAPGPSTMSLSSGGVERAYLLYVPAAYDGSPVPLVLNFHGSGGAPESQLATSGFDRLADAAGFAVAFPAGAFTNSVTSRSWNANVEPGVDDVQFARDVIADATARLNIDPDRIYSTGFSGGARMTSRLACELADVLAAAAPVAGLQYPDGCTPARPIPILAIHGKADRTNSWELTADSRPYWRMGVETAAERWRAVNGCADAVAVGELTANSELRHWADCDGGAEIRLVVIEDGGHVWPDDASERIVDFFARHAR
jgi:polyhydroxybutyrate depolymerase